MDKMPEGLPPQPKWMTEIPIRSSAAGGTFKFHTSLGLARSSLSYFVGYYGYRGKNPARMYEWDEAENGWVLLYEVTEGTRSADLPWKQK